MATDQGVVPYGCQKRTCKSGATHLKIHYSADEGKRSMAWAEETKKQFGTRREWDREMEMSEDVYDGQPVYEEYEDRFHCPQILVERGGIPVLMNSVYIGGWDAGQTLQPAFVLLQIGPAPLFQIHCLLEVAPMLPTPMETFAPLVLGHLMKKLPGNWDEVQHVGDMTVTQRAGTDGQTAQAVARKHGIVINPMSNAIAGRLSAVTWALRRWIDEKTPGFLLDPSCETLREGFKGAYRYREHAQSELEGPGRMLLEPLKNTYSHAHDALQYAMVRARKLVDPSGGVKVRRL